MGNVTVIGIDPGLDGGIATLLSGRDGVEARVVAMPVVNLGAKRRYDMAAIRNLLFQARPNQIAIEKQHAMPGQGVCSMFAIGEGFGLLSGIVAGLGFGLLHVPPKVWQADAHCGISGDNTKVKSIIAAQQLFPDVNLLATERCTKPHDGMADALMIAWWALRNLRGEK